MSPVGTAVDLCCFVQFDRNTADEVGKQVYEKSLDREEVWDSQGKERTEPSLNFWYHRYCGIIRTCAGSIMDNSIAENKIPFPRNLNLAKP